jgi:phosphate transport system substrate-binding protein
MLTNWEQEFHKYQPNIVFHDNLTSTVHGIPALVFDVADIGLLGREIAPLEDLAFRRMFKYEPTEIATATGSFDTQYEAFAIGVFVNKENPISRLTLPQLALIFGCGPGRNVRTWGQLGLTGEWSDKPIHVFGYPTGNNIAAFFELKVLQAPPSGGPTLPNGARWNCDLKEYSNTYDANDKPVIASDAFMMQDLGKDKYAIAYSGIHEKTAQVKALALAAKDGAPYIPFTLETVVNRTYPLGRSMYLYLNRAPGKPLDPKIAEFLRFILSRQGQESVAKQSVFLPLTATAVGEQLKKLQ